MEPVGDHNEPPGTHAAWSIEHRPGPFQILVSGGSHRLLNDVLGWNSVISQPLRHDSCLTETRYDNGATATLLKRLNGCTEAGFQHA